MNEFNLRALLEASGKRMREDLAERLVSHPGELGRGREEILREFLRAYLPKRFEISTGFAFDSKGKVSKQLDIIISNSLRCPHFETAGGNRFYPCESIVAVGQIKSSLTKRKEFLDVMANLESAKSLDRSAGGTAIDTAFGEQIDSVGNYLHQIFTFVFVVGDVLAQDSMHNELMDHIMSTAPHVWPNLVFAMDKYLATFCCDDGVCPNPMHARGIALQPASLDDEILMRFYLLLGRAIEVTRVSSLPYWEYLQPKTWSAEVWYSCTDDPPPYLSSITRG
jgi:hypothetical protein